jgi:hypothetical protein
LAGKSAKRKTPLFVFVRFKSAKKPTAYKIYFANKPTLNQGLATKSKNISNIFEISLDNISKICYIVDVETLKETK